MYTASDKAAITLIILGLLVTVVSIPLILRKIKMNGVYGFRISKAFESDENWYAINEFGGKALAFWGIAVTVVGIACFSVAPATAFTVSKVSFVSVAIPIVITLFFAKRL